MAELLYQYSTSTAWTSAVIRRLTHSRFSHIDLVLPDEGLLGVSGRDESLKWPGHDPPTDTGGVLIRPFNCWSYLYPPIVARVQCSDAVRARTIDWCRGQIGKPFDNAALWHFLRDRAGLPPVGRNWRDDGMWFCSEYQISGSEYGGLFDYPLIVSKDTVSPHDTKLLYNPFILNVEDFL